MAPHDTPERDDVTGTATTGHEWDGIRELDTPLPRWWLWTFYGTILFSLVYVVLYPALPLISSATRGVLGYSTRASLEEDVTAARAAQAGNLERVASLPVEEIARDPELMRFAVAGGRSAFAVNCVQCHGSGAAGSDGYPNLNDDDWLWGGTLADIEATIAHGIRFAADAETRFSEMPAFGGFLDRTEIAQTAEYVLSLSGADHDAALAAAGREVFAANCAICHGEDGQGDRSVGAPSLADAIWLYGDSRESIVAQITRPRHGVMPAWAGRLDQTIVKELTLFVHSLGGGETGSGPAQAQ